MIKAVPREPTPEMVEAGWADALNEDAAAVWRAMFDVAPAGLTAGPAEQTPDGSVDRLRAALVKARATIESERATMIECATMPPAHDRATLDDDTKGYVEGLDAILLEIDEALR